MATFALLLAACGGGGDGGNAQGDTDAAVDAVPSASVNGTVRRTAQPDGDAKGSIYLAIFDNDPVLDRDNAHVVARSVIADADMSASDAMVTYEITDVPLRATKYYFVGFLDDNANVNLDDPASAGPDKGDLVSLDGLAAPTLTLATAGAVTFDVTLNTVLPF